MAANTSIRSYALNWRIKALAFWFFQLAPYGRTIYFRFQKHVTKTIPRPLRPTAVAARAFLENWRALEAHFGPENVCAARVFEFGAGWDLYGNLLFWCMGCDSQLVLDQTRWVRPDQVNIVIRHLQADPPPGARRVPRQLLRLEGQAWLEDLKTSYGIDYLAPADAGCTMLPDASIDAVVTCSVFEHIPAPALERILKECRRILRDDGAMSHCIDYGDHYAHSDPAIGPYNFLRFSSKDWRLFNPGIHHQNRMRHADYARMFTKTGFLISAAECGSAGYPDHLRTIQLAPEFDSRPHDDLLCLFGHFTLTKPPATPVTCGADPAHPAARRPPG